MGNSTNDFKKWIHYEFSFNNQEQIIELYDCVSEGRNTDSCSLTKRIENGIEEYLISTSISSQELVLVGEVEKNQFLEYIKKNFIESVTDVNVEEEKELKEKEGQFLIQHNQEFRDDSEIKVRPHPKEQRYFNIKLLFSILFYVGVIVFIISTYLNSVGGGHFLIVILIGAVLFFLVMSRIASGLFLGIVKGNMVKLSEEQFPEVYSIIKEQSKQLNFKEIPESYILEGNFNAFATRLLRKDFILIQSEVIETMAKGDSSVLKFVVGHELGHLKRKHISIRKYLFPSSFIPFLDLAYSRGREYTCDRFGYAMSPNGSVKGVLVMAVGKEVQNKIDPEQFVNHSGHDKSFWFWLSEKFLTHPHLVNRLKAIKAYNKYK